MSAPLFSKRHYEWLTRWAGENLSPEQTLALANALDREGPRFNRGKFLVATGVYDEQIEHARRDTRRKNALTRVQAGFYQGKLPDGTHFQIVYKRQWEVIINNRRHMGYKTLAQARRCVSAYYAAPEKGYAK